MAKPQKTLDAYFKRKDASKSPTSLTPCQINVERSTLAQEQHPPKSPRIESRKDDKLNSLQRDPGLRQQIWDYLVVDKLEVIDKDLFVRDLDKILRFRDEIS